MFLTPLPPLSADFWDWNATSPTCMSAFGPTPFSLSVEVIHGWSLNMERETGQATPVIQPSVRAGPPPLSSPSSAAAASSTSRVSSLPTTLALATSLVADMLPTSVSVASQLLITASCHTRISDVWPNGEWTYDVTLRTCHPLSQNKSHESPFLLSAFGIPLPLGADVICSWSLSVTDAKFRGV